MSDANHGAVAETRAEYVAAVLGLPDLVYQAELSQHRESGPREVGDVLLVANELGAILQVKARSPHASGQKAASWAVSRMKTAIRQGRGSLRTIGVARRQGQTLLAHPVPCLHLSAIDRASFAVDLAGLSVNWLQVVVIDAPGAEGCEPPMAAGVFFITLDDWHELHRAVRSVSGVLEYVRRVTAAGLVVPLGYEQDRFDHVVAADESSAASGDKRRKGWFTHANLDDAVGAQLSRVTGTTMA